jgi:hypothetical protein
MYLLLKAYGFPYPILTSKLSRLEIDSKRKTILLNEFLLSLRDIIVILHATTQKRINGFTLNHTAECFTKINRNIPNLVNIGQK